MRQPRHPGFVEFALFEITEDLPRTRDNRRWESRQPCDLDSITAARGAFDHAPQKDYLAAPFPHCHAEILYPRPFARKLSQFVKMGREQHFSASRIVQVFSHRPRNCEPIESAGAATHLVKQ